MRSFCLLLASIVTGSAVAAGLSDYEGLFPAFACQDGWAACVVDGKVLGATPVTDAAGRPMPSNLRVGWFDLQPTGAFSPFVGLSEYPETASAPPAPPAEEDPGPVAQGGGGRDPGGNASDVRTPPYSGGGSTGGGSTGGTSGGGSTGGGSVGGGTTGGGSVGGGTSGGGTAGSGFAAAGGGTTGGGSVGGTTGGGTTGGGSVGGTTGSGFTATGGGATGGTAAGGATGGTGVAAVGPGQTAPPPAPDTCDDLVALEPAALMGRLLPGQARCLEGRISGSGSQTEKDKISRVLLQNAEAAGNRSEWERLMKRHLEEIDRSDPNLCFKYALHLSKGGPGKAWGVIKWADYALENKSQWSGSTYKSRVNSLYQLRAEAAVKLWEDANSKLLNATGTERDKLAADEEKLRGMAKDYSREWLDYARAAGEDIKKPMALCVSTSGSKKYCEEG